VHELVNQAHIQSTYTAIGIVLLLWPLFDEAALVDAVGVLLVVVDEEKEPPFTNAGTGEVPLSKSYAAQLAFGDRGHCSLVQIDCGSAGLPGPSEAGGLHLKVNELLIAAVMLFASPWVRPTTSAAPPTC
jgi:hypothetical protein